MRELEAYVSCSFAAVTRHVLEVLEVMRCVLWVPEVMPYLPDVLEGVRCVPLCMLEAVEVVCYVLEAVEGMLCLLEVPR